MKTIIAGGRDIVDPWALEAALSKFPHVITRVVCGMARGADAMGAQWADFHGIPVDRFPADWDRYGKRAGMLRNRQMAEHADALLALWDGRSRGTWGMIQEAQNRGLVVIVHRIRA